MSMPAFFASLAQLVGSQGTPDNPDIGRADPVQGGLSGGFKKDPRKTSEKIIDPGAVFFKGRPRMRTPNIPSLSSLTSEARNVFRANQEGFLGDQITAQRNLFGSFFDLQKQGLSEGEDLISKLIGGAGLRSTSQQVRAAQSARGVALSPASAIQEGLAVSERDIENRFKALGLRQQLAGFSAQTPLALQQLDFGQLLGLESQRQLARAGFASDAQISNINLARDERAENMALLGKLVGSFQKKPKDKTNTNTNAVTTTQGNEQFSGFFDTTSFGKAP